jgi:hypothetical protein
VNRLERHRLASRPFRASSGGGTTTIEIAGTPVFVERVALTAFEAAHPHGAIARTLEDCYHCLRVDQTPRYPDAL